jgi:regulator of protease activity HflC (stomatin/prohibitin superfamily)
LEEARMNIVSMYFFSFLFIFVFFLVFFKLIRIVPEAQAWIVEEFGKYKKTLGPGLHLVLPIAQRVAYKHTLKEQVFDVHPQVCITNDNVQVTVDGILYLKVVDPKKASYGISDYRFATTQMAQTTMRSEVGKIVLDMTFSERDVINNSVVKSIDEASESWGIKVTRYEIRDIAPTDGLIHSMEQQVTAERQKRAEILESEGEKEARINTSKGDRTEAINLSMGEKQRRINEAEGRAQAIQLTAAATAESMTLVARAIEKPGGRQAMALRLAEQFINRLGEIVSGAEVSVLPYNVAQLRALFEAILPRGDATALQGGSPAPKAAPAAGKGGPQ